MPPANFRFGGGAADSTIHPVVAVYLLVAVALILVLPRAKVIPAFLIPFFTIPIGQVVVLGGFHFTVLRVLILAGLARRFSFGRSSGGKYPGGFNSVDWVVVLWSVSAVLAFWLQFMEQQAIINGLGILLDTLGGYLVVRSLVVDGAAMRRTIKTLAVICAILGVCMINEKITQFNVFGLLGGISTGVTVRDGHIRAGGTLGCLYAGAFAGAWIPVFLWLWMEGKARIAAFAGLAGAIAMAVTSYSSTSWLTIGGSIVGLAFWPLRKNMRLVRWGLASMLVGLHMVMKAPVWALIARIDLTGSSSGEQRYMLVDMTIRHFSSWWLIGTPTYTTWGWDSWDLCNQFVAVALGGGLLTLIFYIMIFSRCFGSIGTARKLVNGDRPQEWLLWSLGAGLFATVVAHFGINYMAQLIMGLFPLVVCISVATYESRGATVQGSDTPVPVRIPSPAAVLGNQPLLGGAQAAPYRFSSQGTKSSNPWLKG
jgi:hypothetical protein